LRVVRVLKRGLRASFEVVRILKRGPRASFEVFGDLDPIAEAF